MMENFAQILQQIPSTSNNHSGGATPFKVQVNFDIPIFDGQIDADAIDRWLNLLEGYFSVHDFSDREKIIFSLLKAAPPCQGLVGNLLRARGQGRTLFFLDRTHLELFLRCHQGTILSRGEL